MPIVAASPSDSRAVALVNAQQGELRARYQDTDERTEPFDPAILEGEGSLLLVREKTVSSCPAGPSSAWTPTEAANSAEIKRMYTVPAARGRDLGYVRLLLETGDL